MTLSIKGLFVTYITRLCHHVECHYAECHILFFVILNATIQSVGMLSVILLSVFLLSVILPIVVAPIKQTVEKFNQIFHGPAVAIGRALRHSA